MPLVKRGLIGLAIFLVLILVLTLKLTPSALAVNDPTAVHNNLFGISIANLSDLEDAAKLVNSSGGDWGYVTLVITTDDRNFAKWQEVMDQMRALHLIPILRLATRFDGTNWEKPAFGEIDGWVSFLNSLNWVIQNRYVVINNEVNSAKEWGGEVNPEEYATYLKAFSQKLKGANPDFFIMASGFDASLPTTKNSLDEAVFLRRMLVKEATVFADIDGWASHAYPNPDFSGSVWDHGKGSIRTYEWELNDLKSLGVKNNFPVFITETGWRRGAKGNLSVKFATAYNYVWNNPKVVAVTPFILNYEQAPFAEFSWKENGQFLPLYFDIQKLSKKAGLPVQIEKIDISKIFVPTLGFLNSEFTGLIVFKNIGQSILKAEDLTLVRADQNPLSIERFSFTTLSPGDSGFLLFKDRTPNQEGWYQRSVTLRKNKVPLAQATSFNRLAVATLKMKLIKIFSELKNLTAPWAIWHSVKR